MPRIKVTKEVVVSIDTGMISDYRKNNKAATTKGPLSVDDNIIQVIADTLATDKIASRSADVKTSTSMDEHADIQIRR